MLVPPGWGVKRGRVVLVGAGLVIGLVAARGVTVGERRPVLAGPEWGDHLVAACVELRARVTGVADAATGDELVEALRAQGDGVSLMSGRLRRARPDAATADAYRAAFDALVEWRAASTGLADRLDHVPDLAVGEVARGLAADAARADDTDRALVSLGDGSCLALDLHPVGEGEAARVAGEALLDLAGLRRVAGPDPSCVVTGLEAVPFRMAIGLERGDVSSGAVEAVSEVLDGCLELRPLLEQILADLGHQPAPARCLAGEITGRAGWLGFVETVVGGPSDRFNAAVAAGLETCS